MTAVRFQELAALCAQAHYPVYKGYKLERLELVIIWGLWEKSISSTHENTESKSKNSTPKDF